MSLSANTKKDFRKGEHNTMKKKVVKEIYVDMVKPIENTTKAYTAGKITFSEYLGRVTEVYENVSWFPYNAANAGTITTNEADLIYERFQQFVKKEIRKACRV
jgi:hypothetical protein